MIGIRTSRGQSAKIDSIRRKFRARIEPLEDRRLLARTLFVDDNRDFYRTAPFTGPNGIQDAIGAANPGDLILVGAGRYHQVLVNKPRLTIQGTFAAGSLATNPRFAAIVDPAPSGANPLNLNPWGFDVEANGGTIQGFTVGDLNGDLNPVTTVSTIGFYTGATTSGYKLQFNEVLQNSYGFDLASNGNASVTGNRIHHNNVGIPFVTPALGNGIYSDRGAVGISVVANTISFQNNASIIFVGAIPGEQNNQRISITSNLVGTVKGANSGSAIILAHANNSSIKTNVIYNSNQSAIFLPGDDTNITVQSNTIVGAAFSGIQLGFDPANYLTLNPTSFSRVLSNVITNVGGGGGSGIRLRSGANNILVQSNVVTGSRGAVFGPAYGNGISLEGSATTANLIQHNVLTKNSHDGIYVGPNPDDGIDPVGAPTGNTLKFNTAVLNALFDLEDLSVGAGTAGTGNLWSNNVAKKKNPAGLR